jgi:hypothetical protein
LHTFAFNADPSSHGSACKYITHEKQEEKSNFASPRELMEASRSYRKSQPHTGEENEPIPVDMASEDDHLSKNARIQRLERTVRKAWK